jgi:hypothetical protein
MLRERSSFGRALQIPEQGFVLRAILNFTPGVKFVP